MYDIIKGAPPRRHFNLSRNLIHDYPIIYLIYNLNGTYEFLASQKNIPKIGKGLFYKVKDVFEYKRNRKFPEYYIEVEFLQSDVEVLIFYPPINESWGNQFRSWMHIFIELDIPYGEKRNILKNIIGEAFPELAERLDKVEDASVSRYIDLNPECSGVIEIEDLSVFLPDEIRLIKDPKEIRIFDKTYSIMLQPISIEKRIHNGKKYYRVFYAWL